jgi:hypothetical protein
MAENDGLFGMGGIGLLVILFFLMSGGFGGFGANNQYATSNEVQRGFDNQNSMANQREILGAVNAGTAQSVAATNQVFHDLVGYVGDKYAELDRDVLGIGSAIQQSIANENQCCCNILRGLDSVKFENAQNTAAINANTTAQTQKILDAITGNRMADMQNQINQLQLANQMLGVVKYPMASTYTSGANPFCGCGCLG